VKKSTLQEHFNTTAATFTHANFMYEEIAQRLIEHLAPIKMTPHTVVDLGCGTGTLLPLLKKLYKNAKIIGVDSAAERLAFAAKKRRWWQPAIKLINADACALPLADQSVDLVIANLVVHWLPLTASLDEWLTEMRRILKPNGVLIFSYYGPDTLNQLGAPKQAFIDMHDMGDLLVKHRFADPALDQEQLTIEYDHVADACTDLEANGEAMLLQEKNTASSVDEDFSVTYEIVYAHAWRAADSLGQSPDADGIVRIPVNKIGRRS
jgi:malonyl-CoA O-methyltransferase